MTRTLSPLDREDVEVDLGEFGTYKLVELKRSAKRRVRTARKDIEKLAALDEPTEDDDDKAIYLTLDIIDACCGKSGELRDRVNEAWLADDITEPQVMRAFQACLTWEEGEPNPEA